MREVRYDEQRFKRGKITLMAEVDGWCMVRRPGCVAFTMRRKDWDKLSTEPLPEA